ncbi:MAG: hypothetical protein Q8M00_02920 [bacterium]|nr:hypothetical protein [bacterium]
MTEDKLFASPVCQEFEEDESSSLPFAVAQEVEEESEEEEEEEEDEEQKEREEDEEDDWGENIE